MTAQPFYQLFIDGAWTDGSTGQLMETTNPANGEVWARFACASEADVDRAVRAAARALSAAGLLQRGRHGRAPAVARRS